MSTTVKVGVVGTTGRMGSRVVYLARELAGVELSAALERARDRDGKDVGELIGGPKIGVTVTTDPVAAISACDVLIDFTAPPACAVLAPVCATQGTAYVCASTGMGEVERIALDEASKTVPVLEAANLSVGVTMMRELVREAAARLGEDFDIEVFEIHHRHKRDAPSGTAYALGESVQEARPELSNVPARAAIDQARVRDSLGYAALRGGDVAGEHTVYFFGEGERIE
ncbi:MAG: 4-hydroxy-tetrahydrodipicolinate reductase, partial [Myxococcota bacterium]